ncbi:MAG: hypothetical protein MUF87_09120 [Anaerolineae bacterium]|jgi:hypothetical protein|nr:hypothetical protein [Anaerolineae bacterium]
MRKIKGKELSVSLPFGLGGIKLELDDKQQQAAWQLYVELVTRVTVQKLHPDHGMIREAMTSIYNVFEITRSILKSCGPDIVNGPESLGPIAIEILNKGLRPFLTEWHPRLKSYEDKRPPGVSQLEHERAWEHYQEIRDQLEKVRAGLSQYADILAYIAGAKPLHNESK